jgi:hypothetical protein
MRKRKCANVTMSPRSPPLGYKYHNLLIIFYINMNMNMLMRNAHHVDKKRKFVCFIYVQKQQPKLFCFFSFYLFCLNEAAQIT